MEKQKPILFNENAPKKNENGLYDYVVHNEEKICGFFGKYFFLSNGKKCIIQDEQCPEICYPYSENGLGKNMLGKILMEIREENQ